MKIKYFSMFSGIGGFELGLENSNHQFLNVGYSEIDRYARSIYERHYPNHTYFGDATRIDTKDLPYFDLLVGGFPCQAFSVAGKRKGFNDTRGTLFFEIARILKDKRPEYFLLENVKGLLSHDTGKTFQTILEVLSNMGYLIQWEVLNSKNYGVPQNRERVFIKGYLREKCGREILFKTRNSKENNGKLSNNYYGTRTGRLHYPNEIMNTLTTTGQNCGSNQLICINHKKGQAQKVYNINGVSTTLCGNGGGQGGRTGLYCLPSTKDGNAFAVTTHNRQSKLKKKQDNYVIELEDERIPKKIGSINNHQSGEVYSTKGLARTLCCTDYKAPLKIIEENNDTICKPVLTPNRINKRQNGRRMKKNGEPSFTLTASDRHGVYDGYRIRRLTPIECERLQGFPDNWTKYGKDGELISDTQRYKCCGNAVTTTVITAIVNDMF